MEEEETIPLVAPRAEMRLALLLQDTGWASVVDLSLCHKYPNSKKSS